jgi:hypothetical protein
MYAYYEVVLEEAPYVTMTIRGKTMTTGGNNKHGNKE